MIEKAEGWPWASRWVAGLLLLGVAGRVGCSQELEKLSIPLPPSLQVPRPAGYQGTCDLT